MTRPPRSTGPGLRHRPIRPRPSPGRGTAQYRAVSVGRTNTELTHIIQRMFTLMQLIIFHICRQVAYKDLHYQCWRRQTVYYIRY